MIDVAHVENIGVHPEAAEALPIGKAMNKNLSIEMGNREMGKYIPMLVDLVRNGTINPATVPTQREPVTDAISAYKAFTERRAGWIKAEPEPQQ